MLSEDGLLLVLALGACALVTLGALELVWPTRPRHPVRPPVGTRDPWRRARGRTVPPPRAGVTLDEPARAATVDPLSEALAPGSAAEPAPLATPPEPAVGAGSVVDRGLALLGAGRFEEAAALGREALAAARADGRSASTTGAAQETARLWGLVGLARQGLDDVEGARFALEEAIALAPGSERPTWERHLAALALTVGRRPLDGGATGPPPERVASLRSAIEWLHRGLAVSPDDAGLRDALTVARDALWPAHEAVVADLVARRQLAGARRHLDEMLADPECPPERQPAFRRLLGRATYAEARQATTEASRHTRAGRADEAMAALVRAESLLGAMPADVPGAGHPPEHSEEPLMSAKERREVERRLFRGYLKLGASRAEAGAPDAALPALFRALSMVEAGSERGQQVRGLLARALGDVVDARAADVGPLIDAGETGMASLRSEKLWSLLRDAVDRGLAQDDLAEAFRKVLTLSDELAASQPVKRDL